MFNEIENQLKNNIIPFWIDMKDDQFGGFYGQMDKNLDLDKKADKGCILNSRILWFFSKVYKRYLNEEYLECATHAFDFLKDYFYDKENS